MPAPVQELASRTVDRCRVCGSDRLHRYLDLGQTPLANSYVEKSRVGEPEFKEDLCVQLCKVCGLSQLTKVVHPDRMFKHYLYVSSTTATIREHFAELAATSAKAVGAGPGELAVDIASNDGCLLRGFQAVGMKVLGVDPAENLAAEANANGVPTECAYWSTKLAERLAETHGRAKVITACNVFAHVDDLHDFMGGVAALLAADGAFVIECPYVLDFVSHGEFDTAYHEHLSYVGVSPVQTLMERHSFSVFDVEYFKDIHGGTVRIYCGRVGKHPRSKRAEEFLTREIEFGIRDRAPYDRFAKVVLDNRVRLRAMVDDLGRQGRTVWAYGASAKGNTLMNFFGLTSRQIPKAIDDNPKKWGLYTPGAHMEIVPIDQLKDHPVDTLMLLAWNFEAEIRRRCKAAGYEGNFIVPVPKARIVPGVRG
ncbi:MAG: class I SAM-dependent methyltransferase [Elusimicrobia bacterium]|nr:class I SAM-dependent methyltransferase [Elusimicrobiota bacterium]